MSQCITHTWKLSIDPRWRYCSVCREKQTQDLGGEWHTVVQPVRRKRRSWEEAEGNMLGRKSKPNYIDYDKAQTDARNYWRSR